MKFMSTKNLFLIFKVIVLPIILYLFYETIILYDGKKYYYLIFSFISVVYLFSSLKIKASFIHLFLSLFLFLGFWFKFSVNTIYNAKFSNGNYYAEGTGNFDFSPESLDKLMLISSIALFAFMLGKFANYIKIEKKIDDNKLQINNYIISFTFIIFIIICLINFYFQIYLKGLVGNYSENIILYNFFAWFYQLGSLIILSYFVDQKIKNRDYFSITLLLICYLLIFSITLNSRNYIFILLPYFSAIYIFSVQNNLKFEREIKFYFLIALSILLFYFSVIFSNIFRTNNFQLFYKDHTINKIVPNIEEIENKNIRENQFINLDIITDTRADLRIFQIVKNRFVGIDSLMSVIGKEDKDFKIYFNSFKEKFLFNKTTYFQENFHNITNTGQYESNKKHFVVLPGLVGHLYYSGSATFLFTSILIISFLVTLFEKYIICKLNSICLSSLICYLIVYRMIHFGHVPQQTYKYIFGIILTLLLIFILNIFIKYVQRNFKF